MTIKFVLKTGTVNLVSAAELATNAVEEAKIASGAVTEGKIGSGAVTEGKIGSGAVTAAKIANNTITGTQLAAAINLPSDAQLAGTALSTLIAAAAGGYDFHEGVKTAILLDATDKGTDWSYASHAISAQNSAYALGSAGGYNCNVALSAGDRVAVVVTSASVPAADEANGIYVVGTLSGGAWPLTRASDANSASNLSVGALTFLTAAVSPLVTGQGLMLAGGGYESSSAVWSVVNPAGTAYTGGNGININGSNVVSAVSDSGATTPVTVGGNGLSVRSASSSQTGAMSADQYVVVDALASFGKRYTGQSTSGNGTVDVNIPFTAAVGPLAVNKTALVDVVVVSRSSTDATMRCVTRIAAALSRDGSGPSTLVGDVVTMFKEHDLGSGNISAMSVNILIGTAGADAVRVTGANGIDINHEIAITTRVV
jgi:hypothetical protein